MKSLGLYIHIPFCVKKCAYCDFLSAPADENMQQLYMEAVLDEIKSYKGRTDDYCVPTIFIGGGTPSVVDSSYIIRLLEAVKETFQVFPDAEISIEINPGTLKREKFNDYKIAGINRLSFGLQSTVDKELKLLGRIHSYDEFLENYKLARQLGFQNINVDLISALPGQRVEDWEITLARIIRLAPEHISAYSLIIEEDTPFYTRYDGGKSSELPEEDIERNIYKKTKEMLEQAGYHRYEISNYSRPGYECRHNNAYWTGVDYLGFGIGSASYVNGERFHNLRDIRKYIDQCRKYSDSGRNVNKIRMKDNVDSQTLLEDQIGLREDRERISPQGGMEEFMFLGLRLTKGVSSQEFRRRFDCEIEEIYGELLNRLKNQQLIIIEEIGGTKERLIRLTDYGTDVSNLVMSEFLFDE